MGFFILEENVCCSSIVFEKKKKIIKIVQLQLYWPTDKIQSLAKALQITVWPYWKGTFKQFSKKNNLY